MAQQPQVAVDADGDAVFTWPRFTQGIVHYMVQAWARSAAGALCAIRDLSVAGGFAARGSESERPPGGWVRHGCIAG
jgi:hypothetical protein